MANKSMNVSQNFIENQQLVRSLVDLANITPDDTVVEIGPGKGSITKVLAERAGRVIAVEQDPRLARQLSGTIGFKPNVSVVTADFLNYQLPRGEYKVVANIPFNKTAQILNKLLNQGNSLTAAYLIMQEEAAELYAGTPKASLKSIILQTEYQPKILRPINKREFNPQPKVDAAYVAFTRKPEPEITGRDLKDFRDLVAYGYIHHAREKTALQVFKDSRVFTSGQTDFLKRNLQIGNHKINDLDFASWVGIYTSYKTQVKPEIKRAIEGTYARYQKQQATLPKEHRTRRY